MRAKKHSKPLPKKKCPPILALSPAIQRTSPSFHHHDVCSSIMSRWSKHQASTRSPSGERDASRNASSACVGEARIHICCFALGRLPPSLTHIFIPKTTRSIRFPRFLLVCLASLSLLYHLNVLLGTKHLKIVSRLSSASSPLVRPLAPTNMRCTP